MEGDGNVRLFAGRRVEEGACKKSEKSKAKIRRIMQRRKRGKTDSGESSKGPKRNDNEAGTRQGGKDGVQSKLRLRHSEIRTFVAISPPGRNASARPIVLELVIRAPPIIERLLRALVSILPEAHPPLNETLA